MTSRLLLAAGLVLASLVPSMAEPACLRAGCQTLVRLESVSDLHSYGLLIAAPDGMCRRVRFRVEDAGIFLGQTPPLGPGELAVVRFGPGFPQGANELTIAAVGCDTFPAATRRVTLSKMSPDHGWRAAGD